MCNLRAISLCYYCMQQQTSYRVFKTITAVNQKKTLAITLFIYSIYISLTTAFYAHNSVHSTECFLDSIILSMFILYLILFLSFHSDLTQFHR